jgi:hypothetical protein
MEISRPIAIILSVFTFLVGLFIGRGMGTDPTQPSCPTYGEASVLLQTSTGYEMLQGSYRMDDDCKVTTSVKNY